MAIFSNPSFEARLLDLLERLVDAVAPEEVDTDCPCGCDDDWDDLSDCGLPEEDDCDYPDGECCRSAA